MIAGGKRVQRATPGQALGKNPSPEGSRLNFDGATPPGSEHFPEFYRGRRSLRARLPTAITFAPPGS